MKKIIFLFVVPMIIGSSSVRAQYPSPTYNNLTVLGSANNPGTTNAGIVNATSHLTGTNTQANIHITTTAVGAGTNGPAKTQLGMRIDLSKDNWFSGVPAQGEIDGAYIVVRQGGVNSDSSGVLVDIQNTGLSYLSSMEMDSSIVNPTTNTITQGVGVELAPLNPLTGQYFGAVLNANYGASTSGILMQNSEGTAWGDVLQNIKNGVMNFEITDAGAIAKSTSISSTSFQTGQDNANGNINLGLLTGGAGTPYLDFYGNNQAAGTKNARIISDGTGQLTMLTTGGAQIRLTPTGVGVTGTLSSTGAFTAPSVVSTSTVSGAGYQMGQDPTNGNLSLGLLTGGAGTPYLDFYGNGQASGTKNFRIISDGAGQLTFAPTGGNYINFTGTGTGIKSNGLWMSRFVAFPATSSTACSQGDWSANASYIATCYATNTWVRTAAATW